MSVDLLSRDHGYASERRSAEARFALSLRNARIAARIGKTVARSRLPATKIGSNRGRIGRESGNMRYLDEILCR